MGLVSTTGLLPFCKGVHERVPLAVTWALLKVRLGLYRGYIGIMEKKMETTIMEKQMEKKMENEMETGII